MAAVSSKENHTGSDVRIREIRSFEEFPSWTTPDDFALFLYESLKPYEDPLHDVKQGITDALAPQSGNPGFVLIADIDETIVGGLIMLRTGMKGYVPENFLLMVAVDPITRGKGVGSQLIKRSFELAEGDIKLHVEYDNPAKRLYERLGMTNKYAEMRYHK
ncbi:MAG: GNAT family N-acetyltransferase [candidate division Zixibacteria bacterium]|nr:GNAT family N-acetyltransferase [candidate division Zixibacteria bacterium]